MPNDPQPVRTVRTTPAPTNRCLAVFGTKGGVGKTVVATNLSVSLAKRIRKPVCLVDLDIVAPGDMAKMLRVVPEHTVAEYAARLKHAGSAEAVSLEELIIPHPSGIHLVACVKHPKDAGALDGETLRALFRALRARYEYVVVDTGKGLTDPLLATFEEANLILLVTTPDILSLYQAKWAMELVQSFLLPPSLVKAVVNRAESRGGVGSEDVRLALPCEAIGHIPSDGHAMGVAVNRGSPVVTLYGMSKIAEAFRKLADTLVRTPGLYLSHLDHPRLLAPPADGGGGAERVLPTTSQLYRSAARDGQETPTPETETDEVVLLKRRIHASLVEELDLKKVEFALLSNQADMHQMRQRCEEVIARLLSKETGGIVASHDARSRLVQDIADEALGLGPLEELLADPTISDILVNHKDQIYVERRGRLELTTKKFISNDQVRAVIERIVTPLGRRIDESSPMVDARLPDGSRVNAIIPPLAIKGPTLSIRKFVGVRYTEEDLVRLGSLTASMGQFIRACVVARRNLIISGGTGSGKTTLLNIVSAFIPEGERIITIEDAAELKLAQTHWVSLEARPPNVEGKGAIQIRDLFRNALRMRPDRIVIGECRGAETLDMLQAMNTGHEGSMTTVHANSPKDVISRLDSMVLMSNVDLPVRAIREMVASAVHLILHTARLSDGTRRVVLISELVDLVDGMEIAFRDLFLFQQTGVSPEGKVLGQFVATGQRPSFLHDLKVKGIEIDEAIFCAPSASALAPS